MATAPTGCCPPFNPGPYRDATISWKDHKFVEDHVTSLFHIPLNMGAKVTRNKARIDAVGASPAQPLMLCDETSPWGSEIYIEVDRDVPGTHMTTLSGTFRTRVYDGPFSDAADWMKEMEAWLAARGERADKIWYAYTTCPRCAKAYGHNYVVLFARVSPEPLPEVAPAGNHPSA